MKRIITLSVAALLLAGSSMAQDPKNGKSQKAAHAKQHGRHDSKHEKMQRGKLAKDLQLTEAQKEQAKQINRDYKAKSEALKNERKARMESILTAEQKARIEQAKTERKQQHGSRKAEMNDRKKQRMEQHRKELGITDAQGQQIKAINEEFRHKAKAIRENTSLTKEQKKEQLKTLNDQRRERLKAVLTAEQIQKMESRQKDGREWKEKDRSDDDGIKAADENVKEKKVKKEKKAKGSK